LNDFLTIYDGLVKSPKTVTPAEAGVQTSFLRRQETIKRNWIPVFTGNPGFLLSQEWPRMAFPYFLRDHL